MQTAIDFGRSFVLGSGSARSGQTEHNDPRFWVESALRIFDGRRGDPIVYYQCGSCKAEETFADRDLFKPDNYDFLPAFGEDQIVVFRRGAFAGQFPYRTVTSTEGHPWGRLSYHVAAVESTPLATFEAVAQATRQCIPIVGKTMVTDRNSGIRAEMEYPIKTMNIRYRPDRYQIDTGPLLLPDLSQRPANWGEVLSLAYVAFVNAQIAAFVVEAPVGDPNRGSSTQVMHYSRIEEIGALNTLWAVGRLP